MLSLVCLCVTLYLKSCTDSLSDVCKIYGHCVLIVRCFTNVIMKRLTVLLCDFPRRFTGWVWLITASDRIGPHRTRLVVKTGSAKTKTKTKTEVFETKTANGSMKENAHSSRKNYFYQKLQRHWLMSSLQLSIAFSKHQVTEYSVTHACPVGTHEDACVATDSFHRGWSCWNTIHGGHKSTQRLELLIAENGLDSSIWQAYWFHNRT